MKQDEIIDAWNKQADYMNTWQHLGEDEKLEWAVKLEREALAQPIIESYLEKDNLQPEQKRPQNCGTGYCSCIECVMTPSPRAWLIEFENGDEELHFDEQSVGEIHVPLYTHPPRRTWVDLTDDEIQVIAKKARSKDHAVTLTNQFLKRKNT